MDAAIRFADGIRRTMWGVSVRTTLGRACVRDRSVRMTTIALGHMAVMLVAVALAPLWLLLIAPLVLGVPHVVADVRYLVLHPRTRMARPLVLALTAAFGAMTVLRFSAILGGEVYLRGEMIAAFVALFAAVGLTQTSRVARFIAFGVVAIAAIPALAWPHPSAVVFAHAHNLVALGIFLVWARPAAARPSAFAAKKAGLLGRPALVIGGAFVLASALILAGALDAVTHAAGGFTSDAAGLTFEGMTVVLAPGIEGAMAARLVMLYAFAQAVHYTLWLRLIPNTPVFLERETPPTLRRSVAAFVRDLGRRGTSICIVLILLVVAFGLLAPARTREVYLSLALFHGWLELAAILHLALRHRKGAPS
jgi:hypothetical protein